MRQFAVNPQQYIELNSREFEDSFLNILRQRPANTFYSINSVNNELVRDRNVPRLPSTKWPRMQHFLEDIEQRGIIETSEDSKHGVMVKFLSNSTGQTNKRSNLQKFVANSEPNYLAEYHRQLTLQSKQLAHELNSKETREESSSEEKDDLPFTYNTFEIKINQSHHQSNDKFTLDGADTNDGLGKRIIKDEVEHLEENLNSKQLFAQQSKTSGITNYVDTEGISEDKEAKWICKNAVVQIIDNEVGGGMYFKQKARVKKTFDGFWAEVEDIRSGDVLRIHQLHLRCVVPSIGRQVIIVKGLHRKKFAKLEKFDEKSKSGKLLYIDGVTGIAQTITLPFGHFTKLWTKHENL